MWEALTDILGSAASATVVRRAIREGRSRAPELDALVITREKFEYRYVVPPSWHSEPSTTTAMNDLSVLAAELEPLLNELTGAVVLHRLLALEDVADSGIFRRPHLQASASASASASANASAITSGESGEAADAAGQKTEDQSQ
jgi:hypothetical protein